MTETVARRGLLVTGDLFFSTKIVDTARAMNLEMKVVGLAAAAAEHVRSDRPRCVMLDLGENGLTPDRIREIVVAAGGAAVLAFGSHVDFTRLQEARDAGCTDVMPRSRLAATLPQLLAQHLGS